MHNVLLWNRYVDDILVIYNPSIKNEHLIILNKLNTYNDNVKFTFEEEVNRKINFLDIDIQIGKDNEITTNVYRKETNNNTTIHKDSSHPWTHKVNTCLLYTSRCV